jgi:serine protease Do
MALKFKPLFQHSLLASVLVLTGLFAGAHAGVVANDEGKALTSLAPMLKGVMPCVVNIVARGGDGKTLEQLPPLGPDRRGRVPNPNDDANNESQQGQANNQQGGQAPQQQEPPPAPADPRERDPNMMPFMSVGSGVIVDAKQGYILTNDHLLKNVTSITVNLYDGRKYQARLIGRDPLTDIAVVQIHALDLQAIQFADSNKVNVGDFVAAIGSPFGLTQTVTSGIVSALQRTDLNIEGGGAGQGYENFLQTDASINPGNSGGALVNLKGELVGVNTAILAPTGGNVGIGFAIPADMAKTIMMQLIHYGSLQRGMVGIMLQDFTDDLSQAFNLPRTRGALVTALTPDSPAARAGVQVGDLIQEVDGAKITSAAAVRNLVGLVRAGGKVKLGVLRNSKPLSLEILTVIPQQLEMKARIADRFLFGMGMVNFDQQVPIQGRLQGVLVNRLAEDSPAWHAGIWPGDVIVSANKKPVANIEELQRAAADSKDYLLLNIRRAGGALFVPVKPFNRSAANAQNNNG